MFQQAGMSAVTVILLIQSSSRNKNLKQKREIIKTEIRKIRVTCPTLAIKQWPAVSGGGPYLSPIHKKYIHMSQLLIVDNMTKSWLKLDHYRGLFLTPSHLPVNHIHVWKGRIECCGRIPGFCWIPAKCSQNYITALWTSAACAYHPLHVKCAIDVTSYDTLNTLPLCCKILGEQYFRRTVHLMESEWLLCLYTWSCNTIQFTHQGSQVTRNKNRGGY